MADFNEDAQHPATAIRLQSANREGDAPKSYELVAAIQVTTGVTALDFLIQGLATAITDFTVGIWQANGISADEVFDNFASSRGNFLMSLLTSLVPMLAVIFCGGILSHLIQAPTAFGFKKPLWQPQQINPATGIQRLFSMDNLVRGVLGIPKVAIIVLVAIVVIWNQRFSIAELQQVGAQSLGGELVHQVFIVLISVCGTLLAVSLFDYLVQWYSFQNRMRMTDQQLRDENRLQSTDPQIKSRRIEFFEQITSE